MSLGFHNTSFPNIVTLDKQGQFNDAMEAYYNATTSSVVGFEAGVSQSYAAYTETSQGTAMCALATDGSIGMSYERSSTLSIISGGPGGGENTVNLATPFTTNKRGMTYDPKSNTFLLTSNRLDQVDNFGSNNSRQTTLPYGTDQTWGAVQINGEAYFAPMYGSTTQIGLVNQDSFASSLVGPTFASSTNFGGPALSRDGVIVWAGEGDSSIKEYDLINNTFSKSLTGVQYGGYNGWAPMSDGTLFNPGFNGSQYMVYTPASLNGGSSKVDIYTKPFTTTGFGPWSNTFTGLDGNAYYVSSKGKSQNGGIYSDIYCYNWRTKSFFMTQFKLPAFSTGQDRQNQAVMMLSDGRLFGATNPNANVYWTLKMFDTNNTTGNTDRTSGFIPNTSN